MRNLIHRYDWPNRFGLESDGPNYDVCETVYLILFSSVKNGVVFGK